jgi:hypothetical protein
MEDGFVRAIRREDYLYVGKALLDGYVVNYSDIQAAVTLSNCGMIRLLLENTEMNCTNMLLKQVSTSHHSIILALLENSNTTIHQDTLMSAVLASREDVVVLLLSDPRIVVHNPVDILKESAKLGPATILKLLCTDKRFYSEKNSNIALISACESESEECTKYLLDSYVVGNKDLDTALFCAVISQNNENNIKRVILKLDQSINNLGVVHRVAEMSNSGMLRVVSGNVNITFLEALFLKCIDMDMIVKMRIILSINRITLTSKHVCHCINTFSRHTNELVHIYNAPVCTKEGCSIITSLQKNRDYQTRDLVLHIEKKDMRCSHLDNAFMLAVERRCYETIYYFLSTSSSIEISLIPGIIALNNPRLSSQLARKMTTMSPIYLVDALENYHLDSVMSICMTIKIDLSWSNYLLVRIAACDKTTESLKALFAKLD